MDFKAGEIFAIDKPYRVSSFGALAHVRYVLSRALGYKVKIGHAGTLDPLATGVLILCTGKATKRIEEFQGQTKEYVATLQLGATTASYDMEHEVSETFATAHITRALIDEKLAQFVGDILQTPPSYSAVKVKGERAYDLRRSGESVQLKPKQVHRSAAFRCRAHAIAASCRVWKGHLYSCFGARFGQSVAKWCLFNRVEAHACGRIYG